MDVRRLTGLVMFSVGIGTAAWVRAAPGDLDASFGDAGFARFDTAGDHDDASSISAQTDGKLLVGRINDLDTDDFSVLRFNADGTLDSTFNGNGQTSLDIPGGHGWTVAVLQQADGRIVAAGAGGPNFTLVRYLADGRRDTSFGVDGVVQYDMTATAALQQSDGKLAVAGYLDAACAGCSDYKLLRSAKPLASKDASGSGMGLARFDTVGFVDLGFGEGGAIFLESLIDVTGLVEQPDGKLLVVGTADPRGARAMTVHRLTPDGALDPTFGNAGIVTIDFVAEGGAESDSYGEAIALAGDGRIVVAGTANFQCCNWLDVIGDMAIARLNSDGSLDESFGNGGRVLYDYGLSETIDQGGLVVEPDGAIVVAGYWSDVESDEIGLPTYGLLARFTAGGALDTSFGREGITLIDVGYGDSLSDARAHGIVRLPDAGIVAAFTSNPSGPAVVIARMVSSAGGPGVIGFTRNAVSTREGTDARIVVRRTGGATGAISVDYATTGSFWPRSGAASAGADYTPTTGTLSWTDGDTTDRTIAIPTAADTVAEEDETFSVTLSNPIGGVGLATAHAEVTIKGPTFSPAKSGGGGNGILETLLLALLATWTRVSRSRGTKEGHPCAARPGLFDRPSAMPFT